MAPCPLGASALDACCGEFSSAKDASAAQAAEAASSCRSLACGANDCGAAQRMVREEVALRRKLDLLAESTRRRKVEEGLLQSDALAAQRAAEEGGTLDYC